MRKIDEAALRLETKPLAEERLKRTLILLEIAKIENIHVENTEIESESMRTLDELGRMMPPNKARKTMTNEFVRGMIGNIGADLLVKHTWDYLQTIAHGEAKEPIAEPELEKAKKEQQVPEIIEKPKKKRTTKKVEKK
jgi:FKBP-type peptidyl-prolyl cis-trans isomerase (trigger factor)